MAGSPLSLRFAGLILGATSVAAILSGCWEGTTRSVQATVLAAEGPAMIKAKSRGQFLSLVSGTPLGEGAILETPGSSRAIVSLLPNLLARVDRNAQLEIARLAITKDGNETGAAIRGRYADVRLGTGRMIASQAWGEAIARFRVTTAHGELITTSNALFSIEHDGNNTRITCVSGSVGFRGREGNAATEIPPGFVGEWSASGVRLLAAETEARAQEEVQETLEVEEKLELLRNQKYLVLPR